MLRFQHFSTQTSTLPFQYHPISPTLPSIILSFLPSLIITLSFHFIPISPYRLISLQTFVLQITYLETRYTDNLSFFPSYLSLTSVFVSPCKITTFVFKLPASRCIP